MNFVTRPHKRHYLKRKERTRKKHSSGFEPLTSVLYNCAAIITDQQGRKKWALLGPQSVEYLKIGGKVGFSNGFQKCDGSLIFFFPQVISKKLAKMRVSSA